MASIDPDSAGYQYSSLIAEELTVERARKLSLEQRGNVVITTAGTLVTLLFGLVAVVIKSPQFTLPAKVVSPLVITAALFGLAAILGLIANAPLWHKAIDLDTIKSKISSASEWRAPKTEALRFIADYSVDVLQSARRVN